MEKSQFKYIKGAVKCGMPASIYLYTDVDYWSVDDFLWEFKYLIGREVSKINIHINSAGGSCIDGISVFSRIIDCEIPTACYNDGLAASMASVIWAAGDEVYMKDYSLLMIHNPFIDGNSGNGQNQIVEAFTEQLKTIYQKRFGLTEDEIKSIMDGTEGNDGTFFTAQQAVEKGFISESHIIETPPAIKAQIMSALDVSKGVDNIKAALSKYVELPKNDVSEKDNDKTNNHQTNNKMNEKEITVFAALLGMTGEKATVEGVSAKISSIKAKAEKYDSLVASLNQTNKDLDSVKAELEGAKASVKNLTADLENAKASLAEYKKAEQEAKLKKVNDLVEKAINESKIDKSDKETWVKIAQNDFEAAENILAKIPSRDDIGDSLAKDGKNEASEGLKDTEAEIKAEIKKVVGEDFKFRTFD